MRLLKLHTLGVSGNKSQESGIKKTCRKNHTLGVSGNKRLEYQHTLLWLFFLKPQSHFVDKSARFSKCAFKLSFQYHHKRWMLFHNPPRAIRPSGFVITSASSVFLRQTARICREIGITCYPPNSYDFFIKQGERVDKFQKKCHTYGIRFRCGMIGQKTKSLG